MDIFHVRQHGVLGNTSGLILTLHLVQITTFKSFSSNELVQITCALLGLSGRTQFEPKCCRSVFFVYVIVACFWHGGRGVH